MFDDLAPLQGFPGYQVSPQGEVFKEVRDDLRQVRVWKNNTDQAVVTLRTSEGGRTTRGLALLVARLFLPPDLPHFNSIIQRNGDTMDCRVENLLWRPLWFVREYNKQFEDPSFSKQIAYLEETQTGERYLGWQEPSMKYGLLYTHVRKSYLEGGSPVFPTHHRFQRLDLI